MKVRATDAECAEWHAKARSGGPTLSDLVRRAVGRVRPWSVAHADVERERTRELARIGNYLNQIARWANTHKGGGGHRGRRPPCHHRAGARGAGSLGEPGRRCTLSSSRTGPARPGRRPTTSAWRGTRSGSRARASRSFGAIGTKWPPWPTRWRSSTGQVDLGLVEAMAKDREGHELLWGARTLLPIGDLKVTAHEPLVSSSNNKSTLLDQTEAIRVMEGASGYYKGMMTGITEGGVAIQGGKASYSDPHSDVMAHELGHNLSLGHAPCGGAGGPDPSVPQTDGSIGAWGYAFRAGHLVPPSRPDLMSYCYPKWISDYHFTNALRYRLHEAAEGEISSLVAAPAKSLLLWGGVDASGTPFLEPAFVVQAPASLPRSTGEHEIMGRTGEGDESFSLPFRMPVVADGDGRSSFAFALPVQPGRADQLASITLSGPSGSVTLDRNTNRPVTIQRNPRNGQIRGILRDRSDASRVRDDAVSALSQETGLEVLTSRGIPDQEDWTR